MARNEDMTLFRPLPLRGGGGGGGGSPMMSSEVDPDDKASLWDLTVFAWHGAMRRKVLTFLLILVGIALTIAAEKLAPRTYNVEAHILVVHSGLTPSLSTGGNDMTTPEEEKREAKEFEQQILSRENLVSIVTEGEIMQRFDSLLSPPRKLLDWVQKKLGSPPLNDAQKFDSLVGMLEKEMKVTIDTGTVVISLDWPDAAMARDIVQAAVQKFQDARYNTEVAVIPEAIKVLESHAAEARDELEQAAKDMDVKSGAHPMVTVPQARQVMTVTQMKHDPAVEARLQATQQQMKDILDARAKRVQELNNQLTDLSGTYGPQHPAILAVKAALDQAQQDSPQLIALRRQEQSLETENQQHTTEETKTVSVAPRGGEPPPVQATVPAGAGDAQDRFQSALRRYEGLRQRIDTAYIELQTAEANFKHKYIIVKPAELPTNTKKPVTLIVAVGGVIGTALLVLVAATFVDWWIGLFFEARKVRDTLYLPILGEARDEEPGDVLFL